MMKKLLPLTLLLCFVWNSTAMALIDNFDVAHNYLTDGPGNYTGVLNSANASALNASINAAGKLYIVSTGSWGFADASGPFLYKEVTGDFIAETRMDTPVNLEANGGGLMVRLADVAAGGAGEDNMLLYWMPGWGVGSLFWPTDNNARPEYDITWEGENAHSYLRVERRGANFYWSRSYDGVTWDVLPSANPMVRSDMNVATLQVGLVQAFGGGTASVQYHYFYLREKVATLSGALTVREEGATSTTITVDLIGPAHTAPVDVVITEVNGDPNDLLLDGVESPLTLTFPVGTTQKTFTIQAIDDDLQEGPELVSITADVFSADSNYDSNYGNTLKINVVDNEAGLLIDEGDGLYVDENGTISDSFSIVLSTQPTADVIVTISTDGQINVTSPLIFTSENWNTPQSATVTGIDDVVLETDPHTGAISFSAASSDPEYDGVTAFDVEVTIAENECGAWGYSRYDANQDCVVNLGDLAQVASMWMRCTFPHVEGCLDAR